MAASKPVEPSDEIDAAEVIDAELVVEDVDPEETVLVEHDDAAEPPVTTEAPAAPVAPPPPAAPPAPPVAEQPIPQGTGPEPQVVYVQTPIPPRKAGNRGFGTLIALLAALAYAVLLTGATWLLQYAAVGVSGVDFLGTWDFYIPIALFFAGFVLLVLVVNRAGWGAHVFGSLFVGAIVYFGTIGIDLLVNWLVWKQAGDFAAFAASGFHIVAALLARELVVWFGWMIARHGRKVTTRNQAARAAFEQEFAEFTASHRLG